MVEEVEDLGTETKVLVLADLEVPAEGEVDIRLFRADDAIARRISITCGPAGDCRCGQIRIGVDPVCDLGLKAARVQSVRAVEAGSEIGGGNWSASQLIGRCAVRIENRDGRARLRDDHTVDLPASECVTGGVVAVGEEGQEVVEAGEKTLAMIEVGESAGSGAAILIVDAGDEGDAGGGDVVDRLGVGVGALKIESLGEVMRDDGLEAVVMGIGVGIEGFEQSRIHSLIGRASQRIAGGVGGDLVRGSGGHAGQAVAGAGYGDGSAGASKCRLVGIKRRAQMRALGADVSKLEDPISAELALNGQVPLLRGGHDPMQGDGETKQAVDVARVGGALGGVVGRGCSAADFEAFKKGGRRDKSRTYRAERWKQGREEAAHAAWGTCASAQWVERSGEGEIVHGADIFANAVDAVAGSNHGVMFAGDVIAKADARLGHGGVLV